MAQDLERDGLEVRAMVSQHRAGGRGSQGQGDNDMSFQLVSMLMLLIEAENVTLFLGREVAGEK